MDHFWPIYDKRLIVFPEILRILSEFFYAHRLSNIKVHHHSILKILFPNFVVAFPIVSSQ